MKTAELEGLALDWAVAKALDYAVEFEGYWDVENDREKTIRLHGSAVPGRYSGDTEWSPSTIWEQGGPIIGAQKMNLIYDREWIYDPTQVDPEDEPDNGDRWLAEFDNGLTTAGCYGPTHLIAAMRCYVASKFGEEVEIPEELK